MNILDQELFQRLRWVNQLPLEQLVYPSAVHSRFEHSLGTMFLAGHAAKTLINKASLRLKNILDDEGYTPEEFVKGAAIAGLLHDVGHAPFSHTFEDATKFEVEAVPYDHEKTGYWIADKLLSKVSDKACKLALQALNKDLKDSASSCVRPQKSALVIRRLVDGPIDVDKGDYLLRDAYHCGVEYGVYSWQRLWSNIDLTADLRLCVTDKGAEEAWTLLINRFKMHRTVYKHHVRLVTDAMLVKLIRGALKSPNGRELICPLIEDHKLVGEQSEFFFKSWNDGSLLRGLGEHYRQKSEMGLIERFFRRSLYKRNFDSSEHSDFQLPESWLEGKKNTAVKKRIRVVLDRLEAHIQESSVEALSVVEYPEPPPVFESVQSHQGIVVSMRNDKHVPLADFLGFGSAMIEDEEDIPDVSLMDLPKMPITRPFVEKSRPRLLIFTTANAPRDILSANHIADFINKEWQAL